MADQLQPRPESNKNLQKVVQNSMGDSWWCKLWEFFSTNRSRVPLKLLVPFYVWPDAAKFALLAKGGHAVKAIIVGPTSGPPAVDDPNTSLYNDVYGCLATKGVGLLGYVHISYGRRPVAEVLDDISLWYSSYGSKLLGIFVDEVDSVDILASKRYIEAVRSRLSSLRSGQTLVLNPGTALDHAVCGLADIVLTFENSMDVWFKEEQNSLRGQLPPRCQCATAATVHSTGHMTQQQVSLQFSRAAQLGYSYVFFTDGRMPDPWAVIPSYWGSLASTALGGREEG